MLQPGHTDSGWACRLSTRASQTLPGTDDRAQDFSAALGRLGPPRDIGQHDAVGPGRIGKDILVVFQHPHEPLSVRTLGAVYPLLALSYTKRGPG